MTRLSDVYSITMGRRVFPRVPRVGHEGSGSVGVGSGRREKPRLPGFHGVIPKHQLFYDLTPV